MVTRIVRPEDVARRLDRIGIGDETTIAGATIWRVSEHVWRIDGQLMGRTNASEEIARRSMGS